MRNEINPTPIQDESGILRFRLENHEYSLNVNVKEERELIKKEVNSRSKHVYDWFKEDTGNKHWVFYDTEMYSIMCDRIGQWKYLNYREESALAQMDGALDKNSTIIDNPANTLHASPTIPINATSCRKMFYGCKSLENIKEVLESLLGDLRKPGESFANKLETKASIDTLDTMLTMDGIKESELQIVARESLTKSTSKRISDMLGEE